jgi:predicted dehydrogenase
MKIIIVGVGSIGTRHLKNLVELGHDVYVVDIDKSKLNRTKHIAKRTFSSLKEALKINPDVAFICTFSNDHINPAIKCVEAGCHLFVEKPLSTSMKGINKLVKIVEDKNLISMVGCNMRFHPAISYINNVLETNPSFEKKLWANIEFGYYLPFAKKNYASSYMANKSMGGNLIFDRIHEIDYSVWFFGEASKVFCTKGILSGLKIDTDDYSDMIIKFKSGVVCNLHIDYLQQGYSLRCKVVCEDGMIFWDFANGTIGMYTIDADKWVWKNMNLEIYYNQMYVDEVRYFMQKVKDSKETFNSISDSISILKLALSANRSAVTGLWEKV